MVKVLVVGGGVSGLSVAHEVLSLYPHLELTVMSENFSPNTTSDAAGGIWEPHEYGDTPLHLMNKWSKESFERCQKLMKLEEYRGCIRKVSGLTLREVTDIKEGDWVNVLEDFRLLTNEEYFKHRKGTDKGHGYISTTFFTEVSKLLSILIRKIEEKGGIFIERKISSLAGAYEIADIVINCSGVGARALVPDKGVVPARGQVVRVRAPWIKNFSIDEHNDRAAYIFPHSDCVVLGGSFDLNNWNTEEDNDLTKQIIENCCLLEPSLKDAEVISVHVGLRPCRPQGVRLERENLVINGLTKPVIHNYGHGGCGVTLMWGCAKQVTQLLTEVLSEQRNTSQ